MLLLRVWKPFKHPSLWNMHSPSLFPIYPFLSAERCRWIGSNFYKLAHKFPSVKFLKCQTKFSSSWVSRVILQWFNFMNLPLGELVLMDLDAVSFKDGLLAFMCKIRNHVIKWCSFQLLIVKAQGTTFLYSTFNKAWRKKIRLTFGILVHFPFLASLIYAISSSSVS